LHEKGERKTGRKRPNWGGENRVRKKAGRILLRLEREGELFFERENAGISPEKKVKASPGGVGGA